MDLFNFEEFHDFFANEIQRFHSMLSVIPDLPIIDSTSRTGNARSKIKKNWSSKYKFEKTLKVFKEHFNKQGVSLSEDYWTTVLAAAWDPDIMTNKGSEVHIFVMGLFLESAGTGVENVEKKLVDALLDLQDAFKEEQNAFREERRRKKLEEKKRKKLLKPAGSELVRKRSGEPGSALVRKRSGEPGSALTEAEGTSYIWGLIRAFVRVLRMIKSPFVLFIALCAVINVLKLIHAPVVDSNWRPLPGVDLSSSSVGNSTSEQTKRHNAERDKIRAEREEIQRAKEEKIREKKIADHYFEYRRILLIEKENEAKEMGIKFNVEKAANEVLKQAEEEKRKFRQKLLDDEQREKEQKEAERQREEERKEVERQREEEIEKLAEKYRKIQFDKENVPGRPVSNGRRDTIKKNATEYATKHIQEIELERIKEFNERIRQEKDRIRQVKEKLKTEDTEAEDADKTEDAEAEDAAEVYMVGKYGNRWKWSTEPDPKKNLTILGRAVKTFITYTMHVASTDVPGLSKYNDIAKGKPPFSAIMPQEMLDYLNTWKEPAIIKTCNFVSNATNELIGEQWMKVLKAFTFDMGGFKISFATIDSIPPELISNMMCFGTDTCAPGQVSALRMIATENEKNVAWWGGIHETVTNWLRDFKYPGGFDEWAADKNINSLTSVFQADSTYYGFVTFFSSVLKLSKMKAFAFGGLLKFCVDQAVAYMKITASSAVYEWAEFKYVYIIEQYISTWFLLAMSYVVKRVMNDKRLNKVMDANDWALRMYRDFNVALAVIQLHAFDTIIVLTMRKFATMAGVAAVSMTTKECGQKVINKLWGCLGCNKRERDEALKQFKVNSHPEKQLDTTEDQFVPYNSDNHLMKMLIQEQNKVGMKVNQVESELELVENELVEQKIKQKNLEKKYEALNVASIVAKTIIDTMNWWIPWKTAVEGPGHMINMLQVIPIAMVACRDILTCGGGCKGAASVKSKGKSRISRQFTGPKLRF